MLLLQNQQNEIMKLSKMRDLLAPKRKNKKGCNKRCVLDKHTGPLWVAPLLRNDQTPLIGFCLSPDPIPAPRLVNNSWSCQVLVRQREIWSSAGTPANKIAPFSSRDAHRPMKPPESVGSRSGVRRVITSSDHRGKQVEPSYLEHKRLVTAYFLLVDTI